MIKDLNIRIPIIMPTKWRGFINHRSALGHPLRGLCVDSVSGGLCLAGRHSPWERLAFELGWIHETICSKLVSRPHG